jgi:hypothetical protein
VAGQCAAGKLSEDEACDLIRSAMKPWQWTAVKTLMA